MGNGGTKQREKLHHAISHGHINKVERLLNKGVNIKNNYIALELASGRRHVNIVEVLLKRGCLPEDRSCNALDVAVISGFHEIIKTLILNNFPCHGRNKFGETLLHVAVCANNGYLIDLLTERNCDLNELTRGWAPIHVAVQRRNTDALKGLLRNGADPDVKNISGHSPIDFAISVSYDDVTDVELLIDVGCKIDRTAMAREFVRRQCQRNPVLKELLDSVINPVTTRSLSDLCRSRIRKSLGQHIVQKIVALQLPDCIVSFICFDSLLAKNQ